MCVCVRARRRLLSSCCLFRDRLPKSSWNGACLWCRWLTASARAAGGGKVNLDESERFGEVGIFCSILRCGESGGEGDE